jgi:hypothetical protein
MGLYPMEPIRGISLAKRNENDEDENDEDEIIFQGELWKDRFADFLSSSDTTNYRIYVLCDVASTYGPPSEMWWPYHEDLIELKKLI